jgi:ribosomal protein S18 acetylase RimI-like enzyme
MFKGDFSMIVDQQVLDTFVTSIKTKYKNKIQDLRIEYCQDELGDYIYLVCIKIKKSQKNQGYGSLVMSDVVRLADSSGLRVKLWVTNVFGANIDRLYEFYKKHGFVLVRKDNDGHMIYFPGKTCKRL